jgi:ATP-dependent 26S proteasome regulatory subunit
MNALSKIQQFDTDVTALLRSRSPLLEVITPEEARAELSLIPAIARANFVAHTWDMAQGVRSATGEDENADLGILPKDPDGLLDMIANRKGSRDVWILRDFHKWFDGGGAGAITLRQLRNIARPDGLPSNVADDAQAVIVLTPTLTVPPELANHMTVLDFPLPERQQIAELLDDAVESAVAGIMASPKNKLTETQVRERICNGSLDAAVSSAVGLSGEQAQATFAKSLVQHHKLVPGSISAEKKRIISQDGLLEWIDPRPGGLANVGGLDLFKQHVLESAVAYSPEARAYGLPSPKGVFLMGISGCGKSELAKAIGSELNIPIVRMDLGKLKAKYVGDSEQNLRKALNTIDAIGACEVWVDEVEKGMAGATGGGSDGGVSQDALGAILTWMQERTGDGYVVFTANDVASLPPELMRKGRFDEVFWVDLPTTPERAAIVAATLPKYPKADGTPRTAEGLGIDLDAVAAATGTTNGEPLFTGAEVASLIPSALKLAFIDGQREPTTDDLLMAAKRIEAPMAVQQAKKLEALRAEWGSRTTPASSKFVTAKAARRTRQIDMDN